jgi:hypothetical protein
MYLLYVDDAGSVGNHNEKYFVLGGVALFERHVEHLERALHALATHTGLGEPESLEFHGTEIRNGSKRWRAVRGAAVRAKLLKDALRSAESVLRGRWALFGIAVNKAAVSPKNPTEVAFEQLCSRFDQFLSRQRIDDRAQRGLMILDRSTRETRLQNLVTTFRHAGHSFGRLRNIVDVPFFVDSRASRAIQYADLVTYALWRRFEHDDPEFFDVIRCRFDQEGGVVHGLLHIPYAKPQCDCPYCASRRSARKAHGQP